MESNGVDVVGIEISMSVVVPHEKKKCRLEIYFLGNNNFRSKVTNKHE